MKISHCRSCGEEIIWAVLPSGKRCPMDAEPITLVVAPEHSVCYDLEDNGREVVATKWDRAELLQSTQFWVSHFTTCQNAAHHSRKSS